MKPSRYSLRFGDVSRQRHAFTLIELLVVISIIAVLAGLLLPVVNKVLNNAKKTQAKAAETQIVSAITSYQTDYGAYPVPAPAAGGTPMDTTYNDSQKNNTLFLVLRALNQDYATTGLNTRRTVYFEGPDAKSLTVPTGGFVPANAAAPTGNLGDTSEGTPQVGDFLDPWGGEYFIRIDSNYTNAVDNPYTTDEAATTSDIGTETSTSTTVLRHPVVVWSHGADGVLGTTASLGDDVDSWQ
jgi:prepilin-type N-terminal cleavage/methylation domain-containing protein